MGSSDLNDSIDGSDFYLVLSVSSELASSCFKSKYDAQSVGFSKYFGTGTGPTFFINPYPLILQ